MNKKIVNFLSSLPVQILCGFILGGLFIYASIDKIVHPHAFAKIIYNYQLLPVQFIYLLAVILPWVEIVAGMALVVGVYRRPSAFIITSLLVVFSVAISINLLRGLNFDCGCFSTVSTNGGSDPVGLLIRDILLLIPGLIIILFHRPFSKAKREGKTKDK